MDSLQRAAGTAGQIYVSSGVPAKVVAQAAREFDADLLVIGRHSGAGMYLHQNAYAILRDSPCPVISI
jgi:nucleotide-binding universal stress UspA family protein